MKKIKVCYLWFEFVDGGTGGAVSHMHGFISGLKQKNCDVKIISPKKFNFIDSYKNVCYLGWNTKIDFFINANFLKYSLLKEMIKKEKPDLIYQRHVAFTDVGSRIAKELQIPFVLEYNGPLPWVIRQWTTTHWTSIFAGFLSKLSGYYEKNALERADIITVVSRPLEKILKNNGISNEKILLNPNGVDSATFNQNINDHKLRKKYKIPKNAVVIGFIGTFGRWHGAEVFAHAAKELVFKKGDFFFIFMGDGRHRKETEEIAGKNDRIIFVGSVPHEQVPAHLAVCDILVNPTVPNPDGTAFFGSPTKLFEYMAMGKSIVSSNIGQMKEILENNKDALLVEAGKPNSLKNAIQVLAKDKKLLKKLGKNARKKVVKEYTWKKNAKRVLKKYGELQRRRK
ncbi:MAG: glycosyltransferase family 4 protein [Candidatus Aenigmarchaeota archaeon]|nr:glycosyltransferase family 4 protein [Candidatus Aenigmarchaeota archaeon]